MNRVCLGWGGIACEMRSYRTPPRQTTETSSEWLSKEQLIKEMCSEEHAENYMKWAEQAGLVKYDTKKECKVFYFTKKMEKFGNMTSGCKIGFALHKQQIPETIQSFECMF